MFVTHDPLSRIIKLISEGEANYSDLDTVYFNSLEPFCIENWGCDDFISVLSDDRDILRMHILENQGVVLKAVTIFVPFFSTKIEWTVHNIVNIWQWYSLKFDRHILILEDDTGYILYNNSTEQLINKKLIWSRVL